MPKQRALFKPLEIDELDGLVRLGQTIGKDANIIDISVDQLPDVIRALQAIAGERQRKFARDALAELKADLTGKKPASVRPINGDGPEAA